MKTEEVAKQLVDFCKKGAFEEAVKNLYGEEIVSVEPASMNGMPAEMEGLAAVSEKSRWWMENHEVHSLEATGPFVAYDRFVVRFDMDVTEKQSGRRTQGAEVAIYTVIDGKIVREEFLPLLA